MPRRQLMALSGVARLASVEKSGVEAMIQVPHATGAQRKLITATRVMLETVTQKSDLFRRHGLPETFVQQVTALADQYEQSLNTKESGTQAHVGANADLGSVATEIMKIVKALDRLNRVRFRKDAERVPAGKNAPDVAWPPEQPERPTSVEPAA